MGKPYGLAPDKMSEKQCWSLLLTRISELESGILMGSWQDSKIVQVREINRLAQHLFSRGHQGMLGAEDPRSQLGDIRI